MYTGCGRLCGTGTKNCSTTIQPSCTLSVNGQVADATTTRTILRANQPITISATTPNLNTSVSVFVSPTNVTNGWLPAPNRATGTNSVSLTWTPTASNDYFIVCNNIVTAGSNQCSGNPWCEGGQCSPWIDCGTQDKQVVWIPPECVGMSVQVNGAAAVTSATVRETDNLTLRVRIKNPRAKVSTDEKFFLYRWNISNYEYLKNVVGAYNSDDANGSLFTYTALARDMLTFNGEPKFNQAVSVNGFDYNKNLQGGLDPRGYQYQCVNGVQLTMTCTETVTCTPRCGQQKVCGGSCLNTDSGVPSAPTSLVPQGTSTAPVTYLNTATNVTLSWGAPATGQSLIDNYYVEILNSAGTAVLWSTITANNSTFSVNRSMSTFVAGTSYRWRVRAQNNTCGTQNGAFSTGYFRILAGNLACNTTCVQNNQCQTGSCISGSCRNAACSTATNCTCATTVSGTVFDAGSSSCAAANTLPKISGLTVRLQQGASVYSATTNSSGDYSIPNVPVPGTYSVSFANPSVLTAASFMTNPRYWCGRTGNSTLSVSASDAQQVIDFDIGFVKAMDGWFQVHGGNVLAESGASPAVRSLIPLCTDPNQAYCSPRALLAKRLLSTQDEFAGFLATGQGGSAVVNTINSAATVRETSAQQGVYTRRVRNTLSSPVRGYEYFMNLYSMGTNPKTLANTDLSRTDSILSLDNVKARGVPARGAYYVEPATGQTEVRIDANWTQTASEKYVIFVNGNLRINTQLMSVPEGGFLAFLVKGDVIFGKDSGYVISSTPGAPQTTAAVQGVFIADNQIIVESLGGTTPNDRKFVGAGMFVGWKGIDLQRSYSHPTDVALTERNYYQPTELFIDRPDFALNMPTQMLRSQIDWREIAP